MDIEEPAIGKLTLGLDFHQPGIVAAVAPLGDVEHVGTPAGHHAEAIVLDLQPARAAKAVLRVHAVFGIWGGRARAEPAVEIEVGGHGHGGRVSGAGPRQLHGDGVHFAEASVEGEFAGGAEAFGRPLHRAGLEDDLLSRTALTRRWPSAWE